MKELEEAQCKTCRGLGICDDAGLGDISFTQWVCQDCNGTGVKDDGKTVQRSTEERS